MPAPRLLLSIECSTESASVALHRAGAEPVIAPLAGGAAVSGTLLDSIASLFARHGVSRRDVDAIAFGAGPGAFMGVRTAAAVAQGLAVVRDLPVQPVGTLEALAWAASARGTRVGRFAVVVDARMGEVYHALYACDEAGMLSVALPPSVDTADTALERWHGAGFDSTTCVIGAPACMPLDPSQPRDPRAIDALAVGDRAMDHWLGGDVAAALPVYVRDRVAATLVERGLARAA